MKKHNIYKLTAAILILLTSLTACSNNKPLSQDQTTEEIVTEASTTREITTQEPIRQEQIVDYSDSFDGFKGSAVIYDYENNSSYIYNQENAYTRFSPCSTFKIISALIGLDNNIIADKDSRLEYSGEIYPNSDWNDDLTLESAFQVSCIWYFKEIIERAGKSVVQAELDTLGYGNCDITEWGGSRVYDSPDLNGFWLRSSLEISPMEQVKVLSSIFEGDMGYEESQINVLKQIMFFKEIENNKKIYGKTGSSGDGTAWFVGFLEHDRQRSYFAVCLNGNEQRVAGVDAREIAIKIMKEF